ncbi:hypothetical protein FJZ31_06065 [Candidatus Poribacteria bacterium]|nr:hypothetical protein [Candidatus Poribacteria bacterium]
MATITKKITLTPEDIWQAITNLNAEGKATLASLLDEEIEMDKVYNLPKSFVRDIKQGLKDVKEGNVSPWKE